MASSRTRTAEMAATAEDGQIIEGERNPRDVPIPLDDIDTEESWDQWIDGLKGSEATGTVRVYKLPLDAAGNPTMAKGARQILLITCSHQQYSFDDLILMVKERFLAPGELATIRISGTRTGTRGVMFNRILSIQREASGSGVTTGPSDLGSLGSIISAMQQAQQRQAELMAQLLRPETTLPGKPLSESFKEWSAILGPIMAPVIAAIAQRMLSPPKSDLEGMIGAVLKLKGLADDVGGGKEDDSSLMGMVRAIAPDGLRLLTQLAANSAGQTRPAPARVPVRHIPPPRPAAVPAAAPMPATVEPIAKTESEVTNLSPENEQMLAMMKPHLEQLAEMAARNVDPVEVAKLVLDMLPENQAVDDQIYALVSNPESFKRLALLSPQVGEHAEWFERLRIAMVAEYETDDAKGDTAPV